MNGMSRSKKNKPYFAPCKSTRGSDKTDKQLTHRLFRHRVHIALAKQEFDVLPLRFDEVRSEWDFSSDGPKTYWKEAKASNLRK